ncbi:MAG: hypothetical protein IID28_09655 [Planctomycetes bacterium]|nr:hypothetical protein [Planctomycetota bacterium]
MFAHVLPGVVKDGSGHQNLAGHGQAHDPRRKIDGQGRDLPCGGHVTEMQALPHLNRLLTPRFGPDSVLKAERGLDRGFDGGEAG